MACHLSEITELKYASLINMVILEENFKWHLEAFASELFICIKVNFVKGILHFFFFRNRLILPLPQN